MKTYKSKLKELKNLRKIQKENITAGKDEYMVGLYNGIELCVASMEEREPVFEYVTRQPEVIDRTDDEEPTGRTIASGIKRK